MQEELINFGELKPGDYIHGVDGPVQVKKVYEEHIPAKMYKLEFDEGSTIEASGNHLWYIESELDKHFLKDRIKTGEEILSIMNAETKVDLLELAFYDNGDVVPETEIYDIIAICKGVDEENNFQNDMTTLFIRIAESLGHIMEETSDVRDMHTEESAAKNTIKLYDARRFAQQILAHSNQRYRDRWPIIVGKVVTTEDLLNLYKEIDVEFPVLKKL